MKLYDIMHEREKKNQKPWAVAIRTQISQNSTKYKFIH